MIYRIIFSATILSATVSQNDRAHRVCNYNDPSLEEYIFRWVQYQNERSVPFNGTSKRPFGMRLLENAKNELPED